MDGDDLPVLAAQEGDVSLALVLLCHAYTSIFFEKINLILKISLIYFKKFFRLDDTPFFLKNSEFY